MSNPYTDYIQDLYWMYLSAGYSEESAIQLAQEYAKQEAYTLDMVYDKEQDLWLNNAQLVANRQQ